MHSHTLTAIAEPECIVIDIPKFGALPLTRWAHGQYKVQIPQKYYGRMIDAMTADILAHSFLKNRNLIYFSQLN